MRSIYRALGISLACLALSGCPGKPAESPKREDYNSNIALVDPLYSMDSKGVLGLGFVLFDEDKDGDVDLIKRNSHPQQYIFIAHGHKTDCIPEEGAKEMTPEMQEDANRVLRTANEFSYMMTIAEYKASSVSKKSTEPVEFLGGENPGMIRK